MIALMGGEERGRVSSRLYVTDGSQQELVCQAMDHSGKDSVDRELL